MLRTDASKCQALIYEAPGWMINVGRPVVAIEAVHRIVWQFLEILQAFGRFRRDKFRFLTGPFMADFDPGNTLALAIRGHVT